MARVEPGHPRQVPCHNLPGNSFTHLHDEQDRRKALAEFYAALRYDGILILDQRNYDEMLDHGFRPQHKYYYCSDQVTAEPEYLDDGLARFKYTFPDGCAYTLNMFPVRKTSSTTAARGGLRACTHLRRLPGDLPGKRAGILRPRCGEVRADRRKCGDNDSPPPDTTAHDGSKHAEKWPLKTCLELSTGIASTTRSPFSVWVAAFRAVSTHRMTCGSCCAPRAMWSRIFPPTGVEECRTARARPGFTGGDLRPRRVIRAQRR